MNVWHDKRYIYPRLSYLPDRVRSCWRPTLWLWSITLSWSLACMLTYVKCRLFSAYFSIELWNTSSSPKEKNTTFYICKTASNSYYSCDHYFICNVLQEKVHSFSTCTFAKLLLFCQRTDERLHYLCFPKRCSDWFGDNCDQPNAHNVNQTYLCVWTKSFALGLSRDFYRVQQPWERSREDSPSPAISFFFVAHHWDRHGDICTPGHLLPSGGYHIHDTG